MTREGEHELHRGERRVVTLRRRGRRQAHCADPRDGRQHGKLESRRANPRRQAACRALRHARRGLLGENPRSAHDRHDDGRPHRAARRTRHQREGRARRHGGRRRDRAAYGISLSRIASQRRSSPARRPSCRPRTAPLRLRASTNSNATACASPSRRLPRTAIPRSCAATGTASRPGVRAGSPTIRRASPRSTACCPTPTSRRSCRRSNARCW